MKTIDKIRVYVVSVIDLPDNFDCENATNEEFKEQVKISEGTIYSLTDFQNASNMEKLYLDDKYIRFIEI